jgi:predicted SprT family Zn-dependent metalloprotease
MSAILTVEDIKDVCRKVFEKAGAGDFDSYNIEVSINKRLSRTLGRCFSCGDVVEKIEISYRLLETTTLSDILEVIKHECAHALVVIETGEAHKHDAVFKSMCKRIGCSRDCAKGAVHRTVSEDKIYKYTVICPTCGVIGGKSRMSKNLKDIENCYCKKCGSYGLSYTQNW